MLITLVRALTSYFEKVSNFKVYFCIIASGDPTASWARSQGGDPYITGLWMFRNTLSTLPENWLQTEKDGTKGM